MSRRGQTNARTSSYSRRVPIPSGRFRASPASLPLASRSQRPGSIDRSSSSGLLGDRGTRKCISGFLCSRGSRRAAPQLPEITSPRGDPRRPFFFLLPPPFLPFVASVVPHADLLPLSASVHLFFPIPLRSRLIPLVSFSFPPPALHPPAACRKPLYLSTYLSFSLSSPFALSFSLVSLSRSRGYRPVHKTSWRYLLPAAVAEKETQYFMETDRYWGVHYRYCPALRRSISRGRGNGTNGDDYRGLGKSGEEGRVGGGAAASLVVVVS